MSNPKYIITQEPDIDTCNGRELILVDRRITKKYWWTYDLSLAYVADRTDALHTLSKLKYNNCKIIELDKYKEKINE